MKIIKPLVKRNTKTFLKVCYKKEVSYKKEVREYYNSEMIKKDLEANNLSIDMTYDKILCFGPCH
jgi:hypothetical protein